MSLPIYWPPHNPTHRLVYLSPMPTTTAHITPTHYDVSAPPSPFPPFTTLGPITQTPLVHHYPPPPPLTFSATSSAFPTLPTPLLPAPPPHEHPWPMSADTPSLRSLLPRHLTGSNDPEPYAPADVAPRKHIVHPPPLPAPPAHSQPASPTAMFGSKPSLRRLAELDHPFSAPLPHMRPSMAATQHALLPAAPRTYYPELNISPNLSLDYNSVSLQKNCPRPATYRPSLPTDETASSSNGSVDSPRARHCRSLSPGPSVASRVDDFTIRADSAPPVRPPSPSSRPAIIYPTIPRIRSCAHTRATHDCVLRSYELVMRQQPIHARMCGVGDKSDRRPIDPTPIIQLNVIDGNIDGDGAKNGLRKPSAASGMNHLQNPYYFLFACLVGPDDEEELHIMDDGKSRYLTGTPVSSLYHVRDENRSEVAFFVFPDLGVRKEGRYKLKLTLFEIVDSEVFYCATTFTEGFTVYSAKKFPGMRKATKLSQVVADQGLRIRVRKDPRKRPSNNSARGKRYSDSREPSEEMYLHAPKRPRYSADPYLQAQQGGSWSRDALQVQGYPHPSQHSRMAPPPPPMSSHSARQALIPPEGHAYTPDPYQVPPSYPVPGHAPAPQPKQRSSFGGERWSRPVEQSRQQHPRATNGRPGSARPQSPLTALHTPVSRGEDLVMYEPSGQPTSDGGVSESRSRAHREHPQPMHQPPTMSAVEAGRYAPPYMARHTGTPSSAGAPYHDAYSARRSDIGPQPFSAHSVGSQSMLLPPATARSRPHSPLRYDDINQPPPHTHDSALYRSSRSGVDELSPQMASTSISARHAGVYPYSPHQQPHERFDKPRDRHGSMQPSASDLPLAGYPRYERDDRRDPYAGSVSSATRVADSYGKVDDWRSQQRQHQPQHSSYQGNAEPPHASRTPVSERQERQERHERQRRMESSQSGAVPPLTLPPLSSTASDRGYSSHGHAYERDRDRVHGAHGRGHAHTNSLSRSMTGTAPAMYTPSLGRSSRDVSPATTPGGSKGSANRMGLGHLMD